MAKFNSSDLKEIKDDLMKLKKDISEVRKDIDSGKFKKDIWKAIYKYMEEDYKNIFRTSVDNYYNSKIFQPKYYAKDRQYSLRDMYNIEYDKDDIIRWETDGWYAYNKWRSAGEGDNFHRIGPEYIFEKMFVEGWHGGATPSSKLDYFRRSYPAGFQMAYRTPVEEEPQKGKPIQKKDGSPRKLIPRFGLWSHYPVAKEEMSPEETIEWQLDLYDDGKNNYSGHTADERVDSGFEDIMSRYNLFK